MLRARVYERWKSWMKCAVMRTWVEGEMAGRRGRGWSLLGEDGGGGGGGGRGVLRMVADVDFVLGIEERSVGIEATGYLSTGQTVMGRLCSRVVSENLWDSLWIEVYLSCGGSE